MRIVILVFLTFFSINIGFTNENSSKNPFENFLMDNEYKLYQKISQPDALYKFFDQDKNKFILKAHEFLNLEICYESNRVWTTRKIDTLLKSFVKSLNVGELNISGEEKYKIDALINTYEAFPLACFPDKTKTMLTTIFSTNVKLHESIIIIGAFMSHKNVKFLMHNDTEFPQYKIFKTIVFKNNASAPYLSFLRDEKNDTYIILDGQN